MNIYINTNLLQKDLKPDSSDEVKMKRDAMYRLAAFMISYNLLDLSLFLIHVSLFLITPTMLTNIEFYPTI